MVELTWVAQRLLGVSSRWSRKQCKELRMKAEQRNVGSCLPAETLEQTASNSWEFEVARLVVIDTEPGSSGVITDRDLAKAAYTPAVALYDSCVQYATAAEVVTRARNARRKPLPQNEGLDVALR
jgi:hypothetical protein